MEDGEARAIEFVEEDSELPQVSVYTAAVSIPPVRNCDGREERFAVTGDGAVAHTWQHEDGTWSGWDTLGGKLLEGAPDETHNYGELAAHINNDCRIEVFGIGTNHEVFTRKQSEPGAGPWTNWQSLGGYWTKEIWIVVFDRKLGFCGYGRSGLNVWCNTHVGPYDPAWRGAYRP